MNIVLLESLGVSDETLNACAKPLVEAGHTFMDKALSSPRSQIIVQKVVELAHEMGILVISEGVELPEQARFLLQIGCQHAQGYLYARPLPADAFEALCRQNTPAAPTADK